MPSSVGTQQGERPVASRLSGLGPGLLAASAAIGASHLVSSTQAGALYGWQLAVLIIAANFFKYPFFRFGPEYTAATDRSLVEGYARKGKPYLWLFFILCASSSVISASAVTLLCSVILVNVLPASWGISVTTAAIATIGVTLALLLFGRYRALDGVTKVIVVTMAISTIVAVIMAAGQGPAQAPEFDATSPWTTASIAFLVVLVGWMPAPIEVTALNSLWIKAKRQTQQISRSDVMFDFHVGYIVLSVLALFFLALGVFVQYGSGEELEMTGGAYVPQLIAMYGSAIGQWAVPFIGVIAFFTMFSTVFAVIDGYSRACPEAVRLIRGQKEFSRVAKDLWTMGICAAGLIVVISMSDRLSDMLEFAMITACVAGPVYAWLNFSLARKEVGVSPILRVWSYAGLAFLLGFSCLYLLHFFNVIG